MFLSVPMMRAENSRLSFSVTVSWSAPSTTWLLVTIYPSADMMTPEPVASRLGVCTCRFCFPPLPCPGLPKKPNGSLKKSLNGSLWTSTVCTLEFWTNRICTTAGSAFSAAKVRSTGWAGTAADAEAALTFINELAENATESTHNPPMMYFEYFFIVFLFFELLFLSCLSFPHANIGANIVKQQFLRISLSQFNKQKCHINAY